MDIVSRLAVVASVGTSWIMWLLIGLSACGLAVIVERAVLLISSWDDVSRLRNDLGKLLGAGRVGEARRRLEASPSFEARVARAGLDGGDYAAARERISGESQLARLSMESRLGLLGTLGSNAPFIGLLGTVIGIVRAFRELSRSSAQLSPALMGEIGEALIATALGLLVALPAIFAYNAFQQPSAFSTMKSVARRTASRRPPSPRSDAGRSSARSLPVSPR